MASTVRNSPQRVLFALLAGLLLGLGLGWALFTSGASDGVNSVVASAGVAFDDSNHDATAPRSAAMRPLPEVEPEPRTATTAERSSVSAMRAVNVAAAPAQHAAHVAGAKSPAVLGRGAIDVVVEFEDGSPAPGVEVSLLPDTSMGPGTILTGESDASGRLRFDGLAVGSYGVRATHPTLTLEERPRINGTATIGMTVSYRAEQGYPVPIDVIGPDGRAPSQALIVAWRSNLRLKRVWTPEQPNVLLPKGFMEVSALIDPMPWGGAIDRLAAARSESESVRVTEAGAEPLQLVCESKTSLYGTVQLPDAEGERGYRTVIVKRIDDDQTAEPEDLLGGPTQWLHSATTYAFSDLEAGTYGIGLMSNWGGDPSMVETVRVGPGATQHDIVVPEPAASDKIIARVIDEDGSVVEDVDFRLEHREADDRNNYNLRTRRLDDGAYECHLHPALSAAYAAVDTADRFTLHVQHSYFATVEVELAHGQREAVVDFVEPASFRMRVSNLPADARLEDVHATLLESGGGWGGPRVSKKPGDDYLEARRVKPGRYLAQLTLNRPKPGSEWRSVMLSARVVEVTPGENMVDVRLPDLHEVQVEFPGEPEQTSVTLHHVSGLGEPEWGYRALGFYEELDADGAAVFEDVPAGRYFLRGPVKSQTMTVDVPTSKVVFEGTASDCWLVRIQDTSGLLARSGLEHGDLVHSIDGHAYSTERQLDLHQIMQSERTTPIEIELERGGSRQTLSITPDPTSDWSEIGGSLSGWSSSY